MRATWRVGGGIALLAIAGFSFLASRNAKAQCEGAGPGVPNVWWTFVDSVTACPAGDSLLNSSRPSQVRLVVNYTDGTPCLLPRIGVPPESIWVKVFPYSGSAKANDIATKVFADDSTNVSGEARITLRSLSGCGRIRLEIYVSGILKGSQVFYVRSTDSNADGRVDGFDASGVCDLNYNGQAGDAVDVSLLQASMTHWRRNALHGTPIRRTNLAPADLGVGVLAWEPSGGGIALSAHLGLHNECFVELVPSDPKDGNALQQFTFPPDFQHDYNPSWSPRGFEICFDRADSKLFRKGIPGIAQDTSEVLVYEAATGFRLTEPAFSPNGRDIAFSLISQSGFGYANIYTIPVTGGIPSQITTTGTATYDRQPQWSPDGGQIYFARSELFSGGYWLMRVPAQGGTAVTVLDLTPAGRKADFPSVSTDGMILASSVDPASGSPSVTHTVDPSLASPPAIANYLTYPSETRTRPQLSPDGTRTAFDAPPPGEPASNRQVWAVRRNMNNPPSMAIIGDKVVTEGTQLSFVVSATDPESNPLTWASYFLRTDLGMTFNPSTQYFTWTPPSGTAGNSYWVRFQAVDASGGADFEVVKISVIQPGKPQFERDGVESTAGRANPSDGVFAVNTRLVPGAVAILRVFDASGRLIAKVEGPSGRVLVWEGTKESGVRAEPGVYFYQLRVGNEGESGKWVLLR